MENSSSTGQSGKYLVDEKQLKECSALKEANNILPKTSGNSTEAVAQQPAVSCVYRQDIIKHPSENGVYGMVSRLGGESDSDSDEEEDQNDSDFLPDGYAHVIWSNMSETDEKIEELQVVDRSFLHGDIVGSISDPTGQTGTVVNVELTVDLKMPNGDIKTNVPSRKLRRIRSFDEGDYVLHGAWLGRVIEVVDNVTVLFGDGSKCKILKADPERLTPVSKSPIEDSGYSYYPGQQVRALSSAVFKHAKWLQGSWRPNLMEGTVCNLEVGSVYVDWIVPGNPGSHGNSMSVPSDVQNPKNLKLLSCFSYADWQLGDWCLYSHSSKKNTKKIASGEQDLSLQTAEVSVDNEASPSNEAVENDPSAMPSLAEKKDICSDRCVPPISGTRSLTHESWVIHRKKYRKHRVKREKKLQKNGEILEHALLVVNTDTKVDVLWQDGAMSLGVNAKTLFRVENLGEHDFWPDEYVLEKSTDDNSEDCESKRVGVVKSVNAKERTAIVRWLKPMLQPQDPKEFDIEEEVSVYELTEHPDYNYCIGDIVVKLSPVAETLDASDSGRQEMENKQCEDGMKVEAGSKIVNVTRSGKESEIDSRDDNLSRLETSSDQRHARKKQKAKSGFTFENHSLDVNEVRSSEPFFFQGSSRRLAKAKKGMNTDESDLSSIGNIVGLKDGDIEVLWADGTTSKVGPQTIFVVAREDDVESIPSQLSEDNENENVDDDDNDDDDAASWETVDDSGNDILESDTKIEQVTESTKHVSLDATQREDDKESADDKANDQVNDKISLPRAAFGFMARLATGLLSFRNSKASSNTPEANDENQSSHELKTGDNSSDMELTDPDCKQTSGDPDDEPHQSNNSDTYVNGLDGAQMKTEISEVASNAVCSCEPSDKVGPNWFKRFDSVKDAQDHYFVNESSQNYSERKWLKRVQQDWNILEKNLPDTIYVRVYEDRMDLLRAVIIGATGTPYQDGLYFFDLHLPAEYPLVPPAVYFHSHGLRINPNLYENGKVCLSLLNTWTGKGNEVWDPKHSNILQVLVSIQGLVLNTRPYFNEAGYDRQVGSAEGEKNSVAYNENSFLLSCKLILYMLNRPPQHFETFVRDHFYRSRDSILSACDEYMKGAEVGSLSQDSTALNSIARNSSVGFRLMLAKIIPKLKSAFDRL